MPSVSKMTRRVAPLRPRPPTVVGVEPSIPGTPTRAPQLPLNWHEAEAAGGVGIVVTVGVRDQPRIGVAEEAYVAAAAVGR